MKAFWYGFWLGWTAPIHLLSLRRYRKGQRFMVGGLPIEIHLDMTRWNSIRLRWLLWFNQMWLRKMPPAGDSQRSHHS